MTSKVTNKQIEKLNIALWSQAIRIEKLKDRAEIIALKVEDIQSSPEQKKALKILRKTQSDLWNMELQIEELAWSLDTAVDLLGA